MHIEKVWVEFETKVTSWDSEIRSLWAENGWLWHMLQSSLWEDVPPAWDPPDNTNINSPSRDKSLPHPVWEVPSFSWNKLMESPDLWKSFHVPWVTINMAAEKDDSYEEPVWQSWQENMYSWQPDLWPYSSNQPDNRYGLTKSFISNSTNNLAYWE